MNQNTEQNKLTEATAQNETTVEFDGSWERSNRSLNTAALLGLLGIGVLYFNAQTLLGLLSIGITALVEGFEQTPNSEKSIETLLLYIRHYAEPLRIALVISQFLFMLLPVWWLVKRWHASNVRKYVRLNGSSFAEIILAIIITITITPAGTYIANALAGRMNIPDFFIEIANALFQAHTHLEFLWLVFVVALTPAICEEIFFRGYVQRTFERTMQAKSVILVGVIFGLFHLQPLGLVTLSMIGILLGYFYYRSKSLLPAMAGHFTNNFLAVLVLYKAPRVNGIDLTTSQQIPVMWVVLTLPIAILGIYLYHKITAHRGE